MVDQSYLSLYQLSNYITQVINLSFPDTYWLLAEINEININRNGHCYLELIEKEKNTDRIIAKCRATIWSSAYRMLSAYFEATTGDKLRKGIKILVNVSVEYHEIYSFSLNIKDIDPTYTIGDAEKTRQETIRKLKEDGIFELNKELSLPVVIQNIAVISSKSAAGYGDFVNHLNNNSYNFNFHYHLFQVTVQGDEAVPSMLNALDAILLSNKKIDAVVIIRGGGSRSDLACFDNYDLASNVAQFPLPIITGIGHERDESITDMVANKALKTPTAVADFIIQKSLKFDSYLNDLFNNLSQISKQIIDIQQNKINSISSGFIPLILNTLHKQERKMDYLSEKIVNFTKFKINSEFAWLSAINDKNIYLLKQKIEKNSHNLQLFENEIFTIINKKFTLMKHKLEIYEKKIEQLNPHEMFKIGYSLTTSSGKIVKHTTDVSKGSELETYVIDGKIKSIVS